MAPLIWPHFFTPTLESRGTALLTMACKLHLLKQNLIKICTKSCHPKFGLDFMNFWIKKKWGTPTLKWWVFELKIGQNKSRVKGTKLRQFVKSLKCDLPSCYLNWPHHFDRGLKNVVLKGKNDHFQTRVGVLQMRLKWRTFSWQFFR